MHAKYIRMDTRVQWIRIIASIIVIGCHIRLAPVSDGVIDRSILLITGIFNDGVAIFFILMGFFGFNGDVFITWKKTFCRIFLPALAIRIASDIFAPFLYGQMDLLSCVLHPEVAWKTIIFNLLSAQLTGSNLSYHLWYIHDYLILTLMFPLLKPICNEDGKRTRVWVVLVGFVSVLLTDIQKVYSLEWDMLVYSALSAYQLQCV